MKFFKKIRSLSRKSKLALVVLALGLSVAVPMVQAEFYPDRPTFDYNKFDPNNLNCDDPNNPAAQNGRCGSMNGPVFNSFINTPSYGDERMFFDGRRSDMANTTNADDIQNVTDGSKEVILRVYVHNNANQDTNNTVGVAHGTKVRIALPTATEQVLRARAYISASNAGMVEDTADMLGGQKFSVSYVPGSAQLIRHGAQYALSDSIVSDGALIGDNVMNGDLPGCFDYAATVQIHVKINVQETPKLQLTKQVKIDGAANWSKEVDTKPGANVKWLLSTKNISNVQLTNVVIRDVLPPHVKLVPGSVHLINSAGDKVQTDGPLFAGGFTVGNYASAAVQYVTFNTTTLDDFQGCEVRIRNVAHARSDQTPTEETDTSDVVITKENCNQTTPTYSCDMLTATAAADHKTINFTAKASAANGAEIVGYDYDFGDNTPVLSTDKTSVSHTYSGTGQFGARLTVKVKVNNAIQSVTSNKCAALISFPPTPNTPPTTSTPGTPQQLVNTGPGEVAGLFAATTGAGIAAYRWALGRRLSRQ